MAGGESGDAIMRLKKQCCLEWRGYGVWILILMVLFSQCGWAHDPFEPISSQKLTPLTTLRWYTPHYGRVQEMVAWLIKHPELLSGAAVGADLDERRMWCRATPEGQHQVKRLLMELDVPKPQILVEARVVRLSGDAQQQLGLRWGVQPMDHMTDRGGLRMNLPSTVAQAGALSLHVAHFPLGHSLDLELSAMENMGVGEVIAMPHLVVSAGQEALIESGQRIPYQQQTSRYATTVHFEKAVLSLLVKVSALAHDHLALDLTLHQDKPDVSSAGSVPAINTQVVQTHVVVPSGQVVVLGGIYEYQCQTHAHKVPVLGDLPGVGALFRHHAEHCTRSELLVFLQPSLFDNLTNKD